MNLQRPAWAQELDGLSSRLDGAVLTPSEADYDDERQGFDLSVPQRPAIIVGAASAADVATATRFAAEHGLAVGLQATGHGASTPMDGGLLISTRRMIGVQVDPANATARLDAGVTWDAAVKAGAPYGLAPLCGSAPGVGAISYTLGGGLGPLGRRYGFAADHVNRIDLVTADGRELIVTADQHPDLFWGLRGGGGNFGAVTAIEVGLFPIAELYGGALFFAGEDAEPVLAAFADATRTAPDALTLSIAFVSLPDRPIVPPPLRGRFCVHVRVAYFGDPAEGEGLISALRAGADPILDTVAIMPFTEIGSIHADPTTPMPVNSNSLTLAAAPDDALGTVLAAVRPDAPFLLEVRHLGGALARAPVVANAVGHRYAAMNIFTTAYPGTDESAATAAQSRLIDSLRTWSDGGALLNFQPAAKHSAADVASLFEPDTLERLVALKAQWDPGNVFRFNQNIPLI